MPKLKALILFSLSVFFLLTPNPGAFAEDITITTYYPAPHGVYREMRSKRMAIGDAYYLASDYCWEGWPSCTRDIDDDADLIVEGNVGIGTTSPGAMLDVNGTAKIANWAEQSLGANGYAKIGSLLIQWGETASISSGGSRAVTFPIGFPNAIFNVQTTREGASGTTSYGISIGNVTTTGFTAYSNGAIAGPQHWLAIGH